MVESDEKRRSNRMHGRDEADAPRLEGYRHLITASKIYDKGMTKVKIVREASAARPVGIRCRRRRAKTRNLSRRGKLRKSLDPDDLPLLRFVALLPVLELRVPDAAARDPPSGQRSGAVEKVIRAVRQEEQNHPISQLRLNI